MTTAIETRKLTKWYGRSRGIRDVDLVVEAGQIFGFLGRTVPASRPRFDCCWTSSDRRAGPPGSWAWTSIETAGDRPASQLRPGRGVALRRADRPAASDIPRQPPGSVDAAYRDRLIERLELDPTKRIKSLSRGNSRRSGWSRRS